MSAASTGAMPLVEHLRELRRRIVIAALAIGIALIPSWMYYAEIFALLRSPFDQVAAELGGTVELFMPGVADSFTLQIQVTTVAAIVIASPIWLLQLWNFVTPGLHRGEKKWAYLFFFSATPLMAAGATLAYKTLPIGLQILFGFTPENVSNLVPVDKYFNFIFQMMAIFAIGFLTPLFLVMLNFANLLSARKIREWWRGFVMVIILFAAIATPTGDPLNLMLVAVPILLLVVVAWAIAAINDWRRRRQGPSTVELSDDEASDISSDWL